MCLQIAGQLSAVNAAVAGAQLDGAAHALDVDRPVAAARLHVGRGRQRDDQLGARVHPADAEHPILFGQPHVDDDVVPGLLGMNVNPGSPFFVVRPLLDGDRHVLSIGGSDLDRAVEGRQRHVRLAADGEALLFAIDILLGADADARRAGDRDRCQAQRHRRAGHAKMNRTCHG